MPRLSPGLLPADANMLTTGEETLLRFGGASQALTSGAMRLTYFTARKGEQVSSLRMVTGGTAAGATPTLIRAGIYSVAANGDLTLVGSIANDTTLFAGGGSGYTRSLTTPFTKVAGQRYAFGLLVVSAATMPTVIGTSTPNSIEGSQPPRLTGTVTSLSDLPASVLSASVANTAIALYGVLLP